MPYSLLMHFPVSLNRVNIWMVAGFILQAGLPSTQPYYLAHSSPYCFGFEKNFSECYYPFDDLYILDYSSLATINCTGLSHSHLPPSLPSFLPSFLSPSFPPSCSLVYLCYDNMLPYRLQCNSMSIFTTWGHSVVEFWQDLIQGDSGNMLWSVASTVWRAVEHVCCSSSLFTTRIPNKW